jgi:hypothetical protein
MINYYSGRKKYIQLPPKSKRDVTQNGQDFFELQKQILATSGLSPAGPQSRNIFAAGLLAKKFRHIATVEFKQLLIENLLRTK